jgi:hypothetical protein
VQIIIKIDDTILQLDGMPAAKVRYRQKKEQALRTQCLPASTQISPQHLPAVALRTQHLHAFDPGFSLSGK